MPLQLLAPSTKVAYIPVNRYPILFSNLRKIVGRGFAIDEAGRDAGRGIRWSLAQKRRTVVYVRARPHHGHVLGKRYSQYNKHPGSRRACFVGIHAVGLHLLWLSSLGKVDWGGKYATGVSPHPVSVPTIMTHPQTALPLRPSHALDRVSFSHSCGTRTSNRPHS